MTSASNLSLNIAALKKNQHSVGPGIRDCIWVQGCSINCPGCINQAFLPDKQQKHIAIERLVEHFAARKHKINGCTISGGEPTEQAEALISLLPQLQEMGLSTVMYSGRKLEHIRSSEHISPLLQHLDILIDGPFVQSQADHNLRWRGSHNQRIHLLSNRWTRTDIDAMPQITDINLQGPLINVVGLLPQ